MKKCFLGTTCTVVTSARSNRDNNVLLVAKGLVKREMSIHWYKCLLPHHLSIACPGVYICTQLGYKWYLRFMNWRYHDMYHVLLQWCHTKPSPVNFVGSRMRFIVTDLHCLSTLLCCIICYYCGILLSNSWIDELLTLNYFIWLASPNYRNRSTGLTLLRGTTQQCVIED